MPGLEGEVEGFPRRRTQYWTENKMCFGGSGGGWRDECYDAVGGALMHQSFCSGSPLEIDIRYDKFVNYMVVGYGNPHPDVDDPIVGFKSGGENRAPKKASIKVHPHMHNCITAVAVRSGAVVDAIKFISAPPGRPKISTGWIGGSGGQSHLMIPEWRGSEIKPNCLKEIRVKTGTIVDRICFTFEDKWIGYA